MAGDMTRLEWRTLLARWSAHRGESYPRLRRLTGGPALSCALAEVVRPFLCAPYVPPGPYRRYRKLL